MPRVQLIRGLARTIEKPTSPTTACKPCHKFHLRRVEYSGDELIPNPVDYDRCAQVRMPMDMIFQGWETSWFQA